MGFFFVDKMFKGINSLFTVCYKKIVPRCKNHGDCFGLILKRLLLIFQFKRFEIEVG